MGQRGRLTAPWRKPSTWIIPIAGIAAVLFAIYLARWVIAQDQGTQAMQDVAATIYEGAVAFIRRQYVTIAVLALVASVIVGAVIAIVNTPEVSDTTINGVQLGIYTAIAFLVGAACSMASGIIGMFISVKANLRTAAAARHSLVGAVQVAMRGGAVSGFLVVALSLLGVYGIFVAFGGFDNPAQAPFLIVGFGFGASFVALFAQLGGGIYTKAADVGSDLVGKVEAGIPEDDPRNAGVIADLVGDNVGDCAGRGADLFESTAAENIGAMILGVAVYFIALAAGWPNPEAWIFFPLVVRGFGLIGTIVVGRLLHQGQRRRGSDEDPQPRLLGDDHLRGHRPGHRDLLHDGYRLPGRAPTASRPGSGSSSPAVSASSPASRSCTSPSTTPRAAGARSRRSRKRPRRAPRRTSSRACPWAWRRPWSPPSPSASRCSPATGWVSRQASSTTTGVNVGGIFGTAVATMGMLMTTAYILAMDTFGPITDNAGGIAEFSKSEAGAREITDKLDAVGNTTKALTKGYAIASAALAAFLLFSAYIDRVNNILTTQGKTLMTAVNLADVQVFAAALIASMLVYFFSSLAIRAVGTTAQSIIVEVRRQFREMPGIMDYTQRPDYARVVDITTAAALKQMILPGAVAVATPIAVGLLLGYQAVAGFLMVGTISGVMLATFFNNSGGAWDNAKKYVESGNLKDALGNILGKKTDAHAAAVVGDTVGDPFKDTAGPSLHVLIKLIATITLVLAPLFIR